MELACLLPGAGVLCCHQASSPKSPVSLLSTILGNSKLVLALTWQLMRYHCMVFLAQQVAKSKGGAAARRKCARLGRTTQLALRAASSDGTRWLQAAGSSKPQGALEARAACS